MVTPFNYDNCITNNDLEEVYKVWVTDNKLDFLEPEQMIDYLHSQFDHFNGPLPRLKYTQCLEQLYAWFRKWESIESHLKKLQTDSSFGSW